MASTNGRQPHSNISDFKVGNKYGGIYICKQHTMKVAKTGSQYIDMVAMDKTGEINCKVWSMPMGFNPNEIVDGDFIALVMLIEEYQGKMQAKVENIKIVTPDMHSQFDKSEVIPVAPESANVMWNDMMFVIKDMKNVSLQNLCLNVVNEQKDGYLYSPGAKSMHHATVSGLLHHTTGMLKLAQSIVDLYPSVNSDLLMAGIILHDVCKIREFSLGPVGLCTDYSMEGKLIGHITMGVSYIERKCMELGIDEELRIMLMHMLASHHGQPEFGSPVRPMFIEAFLLNAIDNIDAKVYMCNEATKSIEPGTFSEKMFGLDNVQIYKPKFSSMEVKEED